MSYYGGVGVAADSNTYRADDIYDGMGSLKSFGIVAVSTLPKHDTAMSGANPCMLRAFLRGSWAGYVLRPRFVEPVSAR